MPLGCFYSIFLGFALFFLIDRLVRDTSISPAGTAVGLGLIILFVAMRWNLNPDERPWSRRPIDDL